MNENIIFSLEGPQYSLVIGTARRIAELMSTRLPTDVVEAASDPVRLSNLAAALSSTMSRGRGEKRSFDQMTAESRSSTAFCGKFLKSSLIILLVLL